MDLALSPEVIAPLVTLGGVAGAAALAFFAIRRARQARRRQIEAAGEARPAAVRQRPGLAERLAEPTVPLGEPRPSPAAAHEPSPARPPARVLPLPAAPAPDLSLPVEKPSRPESRPPRAGRRDPGSLAPGLAPTRAGWVARLGQLFAGKKTIDPSLLDEIEKVLLLADIGVRTSQKLLEEMRAQLARHELGEPAAVWSFLRRRSIEILAVTAPPLDFAAACPFVLLIVGVNGSGKTTTIGKLAAKLVAEGKTVLLAAGDTFRAAAVEQLEVWGARVGAAVVHGREGADPSAVVFDGVRKAAAEGIDVVIADTAGRLHTKTNLMDELQKIRRVIGKAHAGAPHETWLVIDATSGQNAIAQAQVFTQDMEVSGIVLTKLDGTAKGGVILGITDQLRLPVRYVGVGERVADLREFDPEEFVDALLG